MLADLAQERDVFQPVQPFGIVAHDRVAAFLAEAEETLKHGLDTGLVVLDVFIRQQLAGLVLEGRIADLAGAAAHQHDRPVTGPLQVTKHHDLDKAADMQAVGRAVKADIGGHDLVVQHLVECVIIGALMDEPALAHGLHEARFELAHGRVPGANVSESKARALSTWAPPSQPEPPGQGALHIMRWFFAEMPG